MLDLEPIKTRLAAIDPYPWRVTRLGVQPNTFPGVVTVEPGGHWRPVAWHDEDEFKDTAANMDLIASAPTDLAALVAEVERLRSALVCERCEGDGTIGWPDQAELCPVCGPTRREIPGHWMHSIPG